MEFTSGRIELVLRLVKQHFCLLEIIYLSLYHLPSLEIS